MKKTNKQTKKNSGWTFILKTLSSQNSNQEITSFFFFLSITLIAVKNKGILEEWLQEPEQDGIESQMMFSSSFNMWKISEMWKNGTLSLAVPIQSVLQNLAI